MKIALAQLAASPDVVTNVEHGLVRMEQAHKLGARLICFPELAFSRFYPQKPAHGDLAALAETVPGPTTERFQQRARELNMVVVINLYERDGDAFYDTSPVIDADGRLLGCTRMIHITEYPCFHEQGYYTPGDTGAPVFESSAGRIGVAICYDRHYPEYMRALALKGADLVLVPQAGALDEWPEGLFEAEMRTAAFQNGYCVAVCNRVGPEECLTFGGESFVSTPNGTVVARAGSHDELLVVDVDLSQAQQSHARQLFLQHRRPELYAEFVSPGSQGSAVK